MAETQSTQMNFFTEAKNRSGDMEKPPEPFPDWVNPKQLKNGQEFVRKNFFSLFFAHLISLIFLLCYAPVRRVLFKTGKSDTIIKSKIRYFWTLMHIKLWYEDDLLNSNGPAFNDIQNIRKIHSAVARNIHRKVVSESKIIVHNLNYVDSETQTLISTIWKDLENVDVTREINKNWDEINVDESINYPISQLDMVVTQFCFMGLVYLFPQKLGILTKIDCNSDSADGLEGFVHIWAVIGHLLGIDDQFNICLEQNSEYRKLIWNKVLVPNFCKCHPDTFILWKSLISGLSDYIYFVNLKGVLLFIFKNFFDLENSPNLYSLLNIYEKLWYRSMSRCFSVWIKFSYICLFLNSLLRVCIFFTASRFGIKIKKDMS